MARNGLKIANSLGCAFHFESDFTSDWHPLFQIPNSSPVHNVVMTHYKEMMAHLGCYFDKSIMHLNTYLGR